MTDLAGQSDPVRAIGDQQHAAGEGAKALDDARTKVVTGPGAAQVQPVKLDEKLAVPTTQAGGPMPPRVSRALVEFLASAPATGQDDAAADEGWALVKAIEALRYYRVEQVTPRILDRMNDGSARVRRAAIAALSAAPS